ncbi:MAG: RelA/SpoT family protein [Candidatus Paceibacterota bacterium]
MNDLLLREIIDAMHSPLREDVALVERAFAFAKEAHKDQTRLSGEPYLTHVAAVGKKLAKIRMGSTLVAAGILHDTLEDGDVKETAFRKKFGSEITYLVKGLTKLDKYHYHGVRRHAESLRKFLLAVAQDVRVMIIKIVDRLHNMETLDALPKEKQLRIALETLEIYAPLANRLGMSELRGALEDLAFPYVHPKEYAQTKKLLQQKASVTEKYIKKVDRQLQKTLVEKGVKNFETLYRIKNLYSLYKKLPKKNMDVNKIYDIYALRVVVHDVPTCYQVLGIVHGLWKPLPDHIKDYIAVPKPNGYQSLHTSIFTGDGGIVEIQIRTKKMHHEAQYGIAAHFAYKDEGILKSFFLRKKSSTPKKKVSWMKDIIEWQKNVSESGKLLEGLKTDFFKDRVFVFTPNGDVIDLPESSTPIDFAYAIHSDIGNHTYGAHINEKFMGIDTSLQNGDRVEIETRPNSRPSKKWLMHTKTALARRHISNALQKQDADSKK